MEGSGSSHTSSYVNLTLRAEAITFSNRAFLALYGSADRMRFSFLRSVLELELEKIVAWRQQATNAFNDATVDEKLCLTSVCHLARSLEYYVAGIIHLKTEKNRLAWSNFIDASSHLKLCMSIITPSELYDCALTYHLRIESLVENAFPPPRFLSVGFEIIKDNCSICGMPSLDCNHTLGQFYDGQRCYRTIIEAQPNEISLVTNPKDRGCIVFERTEAGVVYDLLDGTSRPSETHSSHVSEGGCAIRYLDPPDPTLWDNVEIHGSD